MVITHVRTIMMSIQAVYNSVWRMVNMLHVRFSKKDCILINYYIHRCVISDVLFFVMIFYKAPSHCTKSFKPRVINKAPTQVVSD